MCLKSKGLSEKVGRGHSHSSRKLSNIGVLQAKRGEMISITICVIKTSPNSDDFCTCGLRTDSPFSLQPIKPQLLVYGLILSLKTLLSACEVASCQLGIREERLSRRGREPCSVRD
jgi:hypothetical protein